MFHKAVDKIRNLDYVREMEDKCSSMGFDIDRKMDSFRLTKKYNNLHERKLNKKFVSLKNENKELKLKMKNVEGMNVKLQVSNRDRCYNLQQAENHIYHLQQEIDRLKNRSRQNKWNNNRGWNNHHQRFNQDRPRQSNRKLTERERMNIDDQNEADKYKFGDMIDTGSNQMNGEVEDELRRRHNKHRSNGNGQGFREPITQVPQRPQHFVNKQRQGSGKFKTNNSR